MRQDLLYFVPCSPLCRISYVLPRRAHLGHVTATEMPDLETQKSFSKVGDRSSIRHRRLLSCGLRRSMASSAYRIRPTWRQSVASYRLRRSSAKLGRLARRKKQRASHRYDRRHRQLLGKPGEVGGPASSRRFRRSWLWCRKWAHANTFWFNYRKVPSPISTFADPCGKNSADLG